jgi:hypothetical protein
MINALVTYIDALTLTLQVLVKVSANFFHLPLAAFAAAVVLSLRK